MVAVMKGQETIEARRSLIPTSVNIPLQPGMPVITANSFETAAPPLIYTAAYPSLKKIQLSRLTHACVHISDMLIV